MTPDIFLSYTREDQATAQRFAEAFEAQGLTVWWDVTLRSGEAYDQVTEEALRTAKAVVVLWSKKSVASRWVRAEATLADCNRTLVPAAIEPCERPIMFELTQTADLSRWTGDAKDPAWRAFLSDVRRFVEAMAASQPVSPRPSAQAAPQPASARPALAVLPFINRSGREEDDVFAEAMVEDLTAALSANHWIKVVAPSATSVYRKGARDLRQIGQDLAARYLLEGNVRRVGDDLRVTGQLVDAATGGILWTQKFDRPLAELAVLQEDLVREVAAHLRIRLERAERRPFSGLSNPTRSGWEVAVAELKRAVQLDPDDGPAYASLASAQGQLLHHEVGDDPKLAQEIVENIRRARALDPDDPDVLGTCAGALVGLGRVREALPLAEHAVALSPHHSGPRYVLASILARLGRSAEALAAMDAFESIAPNTVLAHRLLIWRSVAHLQAGRFDQALEAADRALRLVLGPDPLIQKMMCLAKSNRMDRAHDAVRQLRDTDPDMSGPLFEKLVRHIYGGADDVEDYVAIAHRLWDEPADEPHA
jgi:TolB-like protein